jgi:8-oxo-dGTP diphosphatase
MTAIESLPDYYMITGKFTDQAEFEHKLTAALSMERKVVQFRSKNIDDAAEYLKLAKAAEIICQNYNAPLLLATSVEVFNQTNADGLHLSSDVLFEYDSRPVSKAKLLSVSCHTLEEMKQAEALGADILLLSPVKETASHPDLPGIGWTQFHHMIQSLKCPVYALGGMKDSDLEDAKQAGAQGVAAISCFWK